MNTVSRQIYKYILHSSEGNVTALLFLHVGMHCSSTQCCIKLSAENMRGMYFTFIIHKIVTEQAV